MLAGSPQHRRLAADRVGRVVVDVLVGDEHQVGHDTLDRRVAELDSARGQRRWVAERIDEDGLLAREQERGLPVPPNADQAASSTGSTPVGAPAGVVAGS